MTKILFSLVFVTLIYVFTPVGAEAHGEDVLTFTATTTNGYIIDIDYAGLIIEAGVSGTFEFNLFLDEARTQEVEFKDLWVRIVEQDGSKMGRTIFAGPVANPEFGPQAFLYVFSQGGSYTLYVRYNQESEGSVYDQKDISAEIPLNVYRSAEEEKFSFTTDVFVGIAIGGLGALVVTLPMLMRRRRDEADDTE